MIPVVAYIRVSRVGGRERLISPELQEEAIGGMAARLGLEVAETIIELDASGGDSTRVGWQDALTAVEAGRVKGVAVYNFSRFSRSQVDAITALDRIRAMGGHLYSAQEGTFDDSASGTLLRDTLFRFAQFERDRAKEGFAASQAQAIAKGVYMAAKIPTGYTRNLETRSLEPDEMAPVVVGLFERRVDGWSWTNLAKWLIENGGSRKANGTAVRYMIQNPAYLGHSWHGEKINTKAHPAIVSQRLFDQANAIEGKRSEATGKLTGQCLLQGLVRCENCGYVMSVTAFRQKGGYACRQITCTQKAGAIGSALDSEVLSRIFAFILKGEHQPTIRVQAESASDREQTTKALQDAQYDRQKFIGNRELRRLMSNEEYAAELENLNEVLEEAQIAHAMTEPVAPMMLFVDFQNVWESWTPESKREWLRTVLETVIVKSAHKRPIPVADRTAVGFKYAGEVNWLNSDGSWSNEPFGETLLHSGLIAPVADFKKN